MLLLGAGAGGGTAQAQEATGKRAGWGHARGIVEPERLLERLSEELDLSAAQEGEIRQLVQSFRKEHEDALQRARDVYEEVRELREDKRRPTREEIEEIAEEYGNPGQELRPALRELREDVLAVLTPDQREELEELHDRHREEHGRRFRRG